MAADSASPDIALHLVSVLRVEPGDVVVATITDPSRATAEIAAALSHHIASTLPKGVNVLVIDTTVDLSVLRHDAAREQEIRQ